MRRTVTAVLVVLFSLPLSAAITGYVVDEAGKPIRGAQVRALALETTEQWYARLLSDKPDPVAIATAEADERGAFRIETNRQPVVVLIVSAPGYRYTYEEAADGEAAGTFALAAAPMKRGRVTAGGKPVPNATVVLGRAHYARTDANGEFHAPDPAAWAERLMVLHPDYALVDKSWRPAETPSLDVALDSGKSARGTVVDAAGRPVAGAVVRASGWPLAKSAEDGSFTIAHLPDGTKFLYAREGNRVGALILGGPKNAIVLRPGGSITGVARSTKDDSPVGGMRVTTRVEGDAALTLSAITDAKGNFAIDGLQPGVQRITVSHPSFFDNPPEWRVGEGERISRTIAATPYARLTGVVVDEDKRPVAAAMLTLLGTFGGRTASAPDGSFLLRFRPMDRAFLVEASKAEYATATQGPLRADAGELKSGVRIVLARGFPLEIRLVDRDHVPVANEPVRLMRMVDPEIRFSYAPVRCAAAPRGECMSSAEGRLIVPVSEGKYDLTAGGTNTVMRRMPGQQIDRRSSPLTITLERGSAIEGRVVWSDGQPADLENLVVVTTGEPPATAEVKGGAFAFSNVAAGKLSLIAQARGPVSLQSAPVEVTAPASGVTIQLPRPGKVEGRVVDRDGNRPIREFSAWLVTPGRAQPGAPRSFTADDGRFVLENVQPGTFDLHVSAPGYVNGTTSDVEVAEGKSASVSVTLDRGGKVVGRVTAGGRPVSGASVHLASSEDRGPRRSKVERTDAEGEYTLDGVAAGTQNVEFRKEGYKTTTVNVSVTAGKETRADAELSRGRELQGRVVDAMGRPVANADVSARAAMGMPMQSTDSEGSFRLTGLDDKVYTISARKEGYVEATVEANPATMSNVTLTLDRGATLQGRVIGVPAEEMPFVEVYTFSRGSRSRATPDASGAFTLTGVPEGEVTVDAVKSRPTRTSARSKPVKVQGGVGPFVEIDFSSGYSVSGRVIGGADRANAVVFRLTQPTAGRAVFSPILRDGTYSLRLEEPGEYRVGVQRFGNAAEADGGTVSVRGDMQYDIQLRGATVRGRVVDAATGQPVTGAAVMMMTAGEHPRIAGHEVSDSAGLFAIDFVADGRYTINAQKDGFTPENRETVINGADAAVEIPLGRGEIAEFRAIDAETQQPLDAYFAIRDGAGQLVHRASINRGPDGRMRVTLHPGQYSLTLTADRYQSATATLVVPGPLLEVPLKRAAAK